MPNGMGVARLGLVVSSRVARTAVSRNLHKRRIREAFRLHTSALTGLDVVVRLTGLSAGEEPTAIRRDLEQVLLAVSKCLNRTGRSAGLSAHSEQS
jgi:ribonuclease P protein component